MGGVRDELREGRFLAPFWSTQIHHEFWVVGDMAREFKFPFELTCDPLMCCFVTQILYDSISSVCSVHYLNSMYFWDFLSRVRIHQKDLGYAGWLVQALRLLGFIASSYDSYQLPNYI